MEIIPWEVSFMPFVILLACESNEYFQVCINELSKAKKQDQKHFENLGLAMIEDVYRATTELRSKIDCYPRLKKVIDRFFFKETKIKFDEQLLHGSFDEHRIELLRLNQQGAGIFFTVNTTDSRGRSGNDVFYSSIFSLSWTVLSKTHSVIKFKTDGEIVSSIVAYSAIDPVSHV
jgi:hypothetical protein